MEMLEKINIMKEINNLINNLVRTTPGFTAQMELMALYLLVKSVEDLAGDVIEVGSWCGRSAVILAKASNCRVHCVDLFPDQGDWYQNEYGNWSIRKKNITAYSQDFQIWDKAFRTRFEPVYKNQKSLLSIFNETMQRYDIHNVRPYRGTLEEFLLSQPSDFCAKFGFIDGDHDYQSVAKDIESITAHLLPGGLLCVDDMQDGFEGVKKAVNELIVNNNQFIDCEKITRKLFVSRILAG